MNLRTPLTLCLSALWLAASVAIAQENPAPGPAEAPAAETAPAIEPVEISPSAPLPAARVTLGGRYSSEVQEYLADALVPLWSSGSALLALNLRSSFLESDEQEVNAGLVLRRKLHDPDMILGANLYYDTRWTENDNTFDQVGGGIELLTRRIDARANVYIPLSDEEVVSSTSETATSSEVTGGQRITTTRRIEQVVYEEALEGFDAEIGVWLPFLDKAAPTALYAGYYDFSSDFEEDRSGMKARLESRVLSWLTVDAEWYDDDELNRTDYFVGIRVHMNLGGGRSDGQGNGDMHPVAARMMDMVYRDFRIRTLVTDPIEVVTEVDQQTQRISTPTTRSTSTSTPTPEPEPPPPPPPADCEIDPITGDVVCS